MGADAVPVSVMTALFAVVGLVLPFIVAKGPNRGVIQVVLVITAASCWLFWLLAYMHQMNPLIGPQLQNTTVIAIQYLWDHNLVVNRRQEVQEPRRGETMDINEVIKRAKRVLDGYISYRKLVLAVLVLLVILLYCGPSIFRLVLHTRPTGLGEDAASRSLAMRLDRFWQAAQDQDVHIMHLPTRLPEEQSYLPYVGNGVLGVTLDHDSPIYIRSGRTLSLPVHFRPIALVSLDGQESHEALVTEYRTLDVMYQTYAHRSLPSLLLQDIKVVNPSDQDTLVEVEQMGLGDWPSATTSTIKLVHGEGEHQYTLVTGAVDVPKTNKVIAVAIVTLRVPSSLQVKSRMSTTLHLVTSVNYTDPIPSKTYLAYKEQVVQNAVAVLKSAVWQELWSSGFSISHSKAENALNGDLINATIYHVLSQAPAPLYQVSTSEEQRNSIMRDIAYAEGCYGGHQTLQAEKLWSTLNTIEDVNTVVGLWMVTLEKQGCHQLVRAGANGIMQAMILSFGGLRFKNQHLEFTTHPRDLHRDYYFRRVSYGNATHLNLSVVVQEEDYKAVIHAALDRSDRNYYACDAGCLDPPVELKPERQTFPVKLTHPLTALLYITSDRAHMEELKDTIHVREIALAPAHEHHVIRNASTWA
ncbi:hypothetical protein O3P69_012861 [Scylla paramamosain]|uniref:Uncharacterized protein n=1 Tax=Scylla paramamosain TaxID=85552 RepID=A0AAW0TRK1_SCYPA